MDSSSAEKGAATLAARYSAVAASIVPWPCMSARTGSSALLVAR
jgi:hypothetical protein